jgi:hypothetical protein
MLALLALSAVRWLPEDTRSPENLPILALVLLSHVPVLLPVVMHGKLIATKHKVINQFPEILVPPFVAIGWALTGAAFGLSFASLVLTAACLTALSISYIAVRICDRREALLRSANCQSSALPNTGTTDITKRHIYFIRCAIGACSLATLISHAAGVTLPLELALVPSLLCAGVLLLLFLTWEQAQQQHKEFAEAIPQLLSRQLQAAPASLAVYHTGTSKQDTDATKALCTQLDDASQPYVLIVREEFALAELSKLGAAHIWHAEKLSALADCAQPQLSTIVYAQDNPKNSHFTRYTQFEHILVAGFTRLANAQALPQTTGLYTKILASSSEQAAQWRTNSDADLAARIKSHLSDLPLSTSTTPSAQGWAA